MLARELTRLWKAWTYSRDGLVAAWKDAGAFRLEIILTPFVMGLAAFLADNGVAFVLLSGSWLLIIVVELLNTGIEAVTDLATQGHIHPLAKKAKDAGSAAVLVATLICGLTWIFVLLI